MEENKKITTPRGIFSIDAVFSNDKEAKESGYGYYFTHEGVNIYTKHITEYAVRFGIVEKR